MNMINLDESNLINYLKAYKNVFDDIIPKEDYKWAALKHFNDNWNIDEDNFVEMFKESTKKADSLLNSRNNFAGRMVVELAKKEKETVRKLFRSLFDEKLPLSIRVSEFISGFDDLKARFPKFKSHYQDLNKVSKYLWLRYPNKYYIYRYTDVMNAGKMLGASLTIKQGTDFNNLKETFELYDKILEYVKKDDVIIGKIEERLGENIGELDDFHTVVNDFSFFLRHWYNKYYKSGNDVGAITATDKKMGHEEKTRYWWLCANPQIWSMDAWHIGEEQSYTLYNDNGNKRRVFKNFEEAKAGDKVICYETTPNKQIVGLAIISKETDGKNIYFKKTETIVNPVDFETIKENDELGNMEFLKNPNGSFFKLTKEEYNVILDLIRDTNKPNRQINRLIKYTKENFLKEVYMSEESYEELRRLLLNKMNIILQGAPGVGKTFCAKRLAYSIMGCKDDTHVQMVQFHQNYSYEDFIIGYRPSGETFELKIGVFYKFCLEASNNPDEKYFFIIDEINRGNLSKIFGELMMLIEKDYRGETIVLPNGGKSMFVPKNLYIIGMMNTADRSLAMLDYALRRRFSFFDMEPGFNTDGFKDLVKSATGTHIEKIIYTIKQLNDDIIKDDSLGKGFEIGHSYFCQQELTDKYLELIVKHDIIPMLREYWFDDASKVEKWKNDFENALK